MLTLTIGYVRDARSLSVKNLRLKIFLFFFNQTSFVL